MYSIHGLRAEFHPSKVEIRVRVPVDAFFILQNYKNLGLWNQFIELYSMRNQMKKGLSNEKIKNDRKGIVLRIKLNDSKKWKHKWKENIFIKIIFYGLQNNF